MKDLISIITVNYFSEAEILASLQSIVAHTTDTNFEYIVVSNSPLDPTFEAQLLGIHSDSKCVQQSDNVGFAKACNDGVEFAKGSHVFLLNPDTRFNEDALRKLHAFTETRPNSVVGPLTLDEDSNVSPTVKSHFSLGFFLSWVIPFFDRFFSPPKFIPYSPDTSQKVDVLNGSAIFCRKAIYQQLGGMSDDFFMYWEENDLAEKARKSGIPFYFLMECSIIHKQGTSTSPYFLEMELHKHRSQLTFIKRYYAEYIFLNRVSGIISYAWRWFIKKFKKEDLKYAQYSTLLKWYLFEYE